METISYKMAQFAEKIRYEDLPAEVVHQVKRFLFDSVGCALAGTHGHDPIIYRDMTLNLTLTGSGTKLASFKLDGQTQEPNIPATLTGEHDIELVMR